MMREGLDRTKLDEWDTRTMVARTDLINAMAGTIMQTMQHGGDVIATERTIAALCLTLNINYRVIAERVHAVKIVTP